MIWIAGLNKRRPSPTAVAAAGAPSRRASRDRCRSPNGRHPIASGGRKRAGRRRGSSAAGRRVILPRSARPTSPTDMVCTWTFCSATDDSTRPGARSTLVTPDNVDGFMTELQARVRSVTVWNSVYKLRRAAQLIAPGADFGWLTEIEKDIALVMVPRSKADRLVLTERLVEAGLTLIREAEMFGKTGFARAVGVRNGLLIALLALHPIRIKNFAALTIADTFINIDGRWWLHIPSDDTKSHRVDERQVPEFITDVVNSYIKTHRPVLCRGDAEQLALWVSSTTGRSTYYQEPRYPDLENHA